MPLYLIDIDERLGYISDDGTVRYDGPLEIQPLVDDIFEEEAATSDALERLIIELSEEFPIVEIGWDPSGTFPPSAKRFL